VFANVPSWLDAKVRGLSAEIDPMDRETIYYAAAGWTIAWYLRKDIQAHGVDGFFDPPRKRPVNGNDTEWQDHVNRAILVAEALFLLRSSPGFEEQRKRLAERPLRSAFFEMLAAKQFLKAGFQISAAPEVGKLGEDFDFTATRADGMIVNVEVTALTGKEPSEATIFNALRNKRRQLPKSAPGVVYCVLPENWSRAAAINWEGFLQNIVERFFRSTTRVNVIVFWMEQHLIRGDGGPGAALVLIRKPYVNDKAHHAMTDVSFLLSGPRSETAREALATGAGLDALKETSYDSEFFRWVDHLNPVARD
jgi:hypothetical protein